ncbi:MAG TPA: ABC transporter substrate-binding protein, partial [Mycobacteriales bacterium]|nr:ABC transporter substrate-binding protein [Mycobacteriales bacterium]
MKRLKKMTRDGLLASRITRRQTMQAGAAVAAGTGLAACSGGGGKSYNGSGNKGGNDTHPVGKGIAPTPRNKTVVIDQINMTVFDRFNPFIPNGESYQGGVGQIAKEYLWYANLATGETKAWLGKSYSYSSDFKKFTIKLNPAAKWSDGKPFTSADVKFTMEMVKKNPTLLGSGPVVTEAKSISAPDPQTVVIELNTRDPRYHYNFICGIIGTSFPIVPEHVWSGKDPTSFANNPPVYTGPYVLDSVNADHQLFVWKKNANYWAKSEMDPEPEYVVFRNSPSPDAEFQQFKQAQADVSANSGMYQLMKSAIDSGYKDSIITEMTDPCPSAFFVNC